MESLFPPLFHRKARGHYLITPALSTAKDPEA
jgi:hypothetical protein